MRIIAAATLLALPLLAGCITGTEMTALPERIDYVCAGNRVLPVLRGNERSAIVLVEGREYLLVRAPSAAQEKYTDSRFTLYLEGEKAMLEDQNRVIFGPCISPVPLPTYYR